MPDYGRKTVAELHEILRGRSLPHTGKKAELVARLHEADKSYETKPEQTAPPSVPPSDPNDEKEAPPAEPVAAKEAPEETPVPADTTETASLAPPQTTEIEREGSTATDAKLAAAVDYSIGLNQSSYDDEVKKRKARAERFGARGEEVDVEAQKAAERAKRFGTGAAANGGVAKLDEALPTEREKGGKRGRDGESARDDPGLKQGRRTKRRFRGKSGRDDQQVQKPTGVQKSVSKATSAFSSEKDRLAAEARKKKFATA